MGDCGPGTQTGVSVKKKTGDTVRLDVWATDSAGGPVDVTGWAWLCQLRDDADQLVDAFTVDVTDGPGGHLQLVLQDAPEPGDYLFDLQGTDPQADVRTILDGRLRTTADVSRGT